MYAFILVFVGGGLGSICRYAISLSLQPWQARFPWATLAANALACVVLGALLGWQAAGQLPDARRWLLATGFCGGFSTFSTFTAESWQLYQTGHASVALGNVLLNFLLCLGCLLLGLKLTSV